MSEENVPSKEVLEFACGTHASVTKLYQRSTYAGLLEGYPNHRLNDNLVTQFIERVAKESGRKPYVIQPTEILKPEKIANERNPWMELPHVECEAHLSSKSFGEFGSSLVVCWYQSEFAFPIDSRTLKELRGIKWHEHAQSHDDF